MQKGRDEILEAMNPDVIAERARLYRKVGPSPSDMVYPVVKPQTNAKAKAATKRKAQRAARRITRKS